MNKDFYGTESYKKKQSLITRSKWKSGTFDFLKKRIKRTCQNISCSNVFFAIPSDPKIFCSQSCSAKTNNRKRILSIFTKEKISFALKGRPNPRKGILKSERIKIVCLNPICNKEFLSESWRLRKYCSTKCAMAIIGSQPTSPKAARAKAGIRQDLGDYYFYSRWEANFARLLNFLNIKWEYQPKTFDLKTQKYTPDFYLPEHELFIEIKNYLSEFSKDRDTKFRSLYPNTRLYLLLKPDYLELQEFFSRKIKNWEYS